MSQYDLGLKGERLAEAYLKEKGFAIRKRRLRTWGGEVDLIASRQGILYFIEVKYRPDGRLGSGLISISPRKKQSLLSAAGEYLAKTPSPWRLAYLEITRAGIRFHEDVLHEN